MNNPKIVITLGRHSLAKMLPGESISKARGRPRKMGNFILFPMYHPAAALHQPSLRKVVEADFKAIISLLEETKLAGQEKTNVQQLSMF